MYKNLFIIIFILLTAYLNAQISHGGYPLSLLSTETKTVISIEEVSIDYEYIDKSIEESRSGCLEHVGTFIKADYTNNNIGTWQISEDGSDIYKVAFRVGKSAGVSISFSDIYIPEGGKLFFYNESGSSILGSFDCSNILEDNSFFIEPLSGNIIYMEYNNSHNFDKDFTFKIDGFGYFYETKFLGNNRELNFGGSGDCNVNINCPEGSSVRKVANAVVKILVLGNGQYYLCTGTLMNNTKEDRTPYILTAWHCSTNTRPGEFSKWTFYFQYESSSCDEPLAEPEHKTMIGCDPLAYSEKYGFIQKSDFYLLRLKDDNIPAHYNPYFAGWDATGKYEVSAKGVHHPKGDIKKVSTTTHITEDSWMKGSKELTHWKVYWDDTESGHGITEGGSSGSPLLNNHGKVIGTLSGGTSECTNLNGFDKYGKMSYSWNSNGTDSASRLDVWLDPKNSGALEFHGYNDMLDIFSLNPSINSSETYINTNPTLVVGDRLSFNPDFSVFPDSCLWEFEGAEPSRSTDNNPHGIQYLEMGKYDISVTVYKKGHQPKVFDYKDFVNVTPGLYPVPFQNKITVVLSENTSEEVDVQQYNLIRLISTDSKESYLPSGIEYLYNKITIYFDNIVKGMYVLQLISDKEEVNLLIGKH